MQVGQAYVLTKMWKWVGDMGGGYKFIIHMVKIKQFLAGGDMSSESTTSLKAWPGCILITVISIKHYFIWGWCKHVIKEWYPQKFCLVAVKNYVNLLFNSNNNRSNSIHDCGNVYGNNNLCYIDLYYYCESAKQLVMRKQIQIDDWAAFQRESTATVPYLQGIWRQIIASFASE